MMAQAEQDQLTRQVGRSLLTVAGEGWQRVRAEYRSAGRHIEVDVFVTGPDGAEQTVRPPQEVVEGLGRLRQGMYRPGRGTWLSGVYLLEPPSSFSAEFEPDAEPEWRRVPPQIGFADELKFFPRADENIPDWLRRRAGLPPLPPAPADQPTPPPGAPAGPHAGGEPTPPPGTPAGQPPFTGQPTPPRGNQPPFDGRPAQPPGGESTPPPGIPAGPFNQSAHEPPPQFGGPPAGPVGGQPTRAPQPAGEPAPPPGIPAGPFGGRPANEPAPPQHGGGQGGPFGGPPTPPPGIPAHEAPPRSADVPAGPFGGEATPPPGTPAHDSAPPRFGTQPGARFGGEPTPPSGIPANQFGQPTPPPGIPATPPAPSAAPGIGSAFGGRPAPERPPFGGEPGNQRPGDPWFNEPDANPAPGFGVPATPFAQPDEHR